MSDPKLDLEIVRFVAAPRAKVWRAWERSAHPQAVVVPEALDD